MSKLLSFARVALAGLLTSLISPLLGQTVDPAVGVAVKIYAKGVTNGTGNLALSGTFLSDTPGQPDVLVSNTTSTTTVGTTLTTVLGTQGYVRVEPGKTYTLYVNAPAIPNGELNIVAPAGYRVVMDHLIRSRQTFSGVLNTVFELQPLGVRHPSLAGMASFAPSNEIEWRVSLGALRNGGSAGELALIDNGAAPTWGPIFTPARLYYEPTSEEVWVYRPNLTIRQIRANQVVIDIYRPPGVTTWYEVRCYHPSQERTQQIPHSDESTFVGQPFVTYRVEQGMTATSLKITKEIRNVVDPVATNLPVARKEILTVARSGTWPTATWTKTDWTVDGQSPLAEIVVQSAGTTSSRTETVYVGGISAPAVKITRNYSVPLTNGVSVIGEVLAAESVGTNSGTNSAFTYHADPTKFGSLGYLKNVIKPGGNWEAYDYYDSDLASGFRGGRVKYRYRPYLTAPVAPTMEPAQGEVTYYEYVNDLFGVPNRPSSIQKKINNVPVAKTTTTYNDSALNANGSIIAQAIRTEYSSSTQSLQTTVRSYRDDHPDSFVRGQAYAVTGPDGVKQSFAYQRGSLNGTVFTPGVGIGVGGDATRVSVITGAASAAPEGSYLSSLGTYQLDGLYVIDGKSGMDVTIRDSSALVVRTESHIWKSGAWQPTTWTNYTYDFAGRLIRRNGSNGTIYTATYDGGLKINDIDEAGVKTTYAYDVHGRISIVTRTGSGTIGAVATKFTYDAAGHVTKEEAGYGQSEVITTQRAYDDAGRITTHTPPGNYGIVTYAYDIPNRTQTTTRADGSTIITTDYIDGKTHSITGTGVVPVYHTHGVEADGRRWHEGRVGTTTSPRWKKTWKDWFGREERIEYPGFTGQPNIVGENFYGTVTNQSSAGHLIKTTKTGFAPTLYVYNALGQVSRSGLDYNNNGMLDLAGNDRITESSTYLESYTGTWWLRTDTRSYPKLGLNTVIVTSTSRTRVSGHTGNRISERQSIDAEGNVTTQTVDIDRDARTGIATVKRSGLAQSTVENTVNGVSMSVTTFDGLTASNSYDALLRRSAVTDSRGNTSTSTFILGTDMVSSVANAAGNTAVTTYDNVGRVSTQRDPKNFYTRYAYNARGQVIRQWGDGTMPVSYGYDSTYGDRITQSTYRAGTDWAGATWPANPGTADTTTWTYDGPSGLLTAKIHPAANPGSPDPVLNQPKSVTQTYNLRGQTATRTHARGVVTNYGYDNATGELLTQTYSDSTPAVTYTYGRTGQMETVADFTGTRDLVYDPNKPWRMTAEAHSSFYGSRVMTRLYDETGTIGRVRGFKLGASVGSNSDLEQTFGFTTVGRFETLSSSSPQLSTASRTFRYAYLANSALLQSMTADGTSFQVSRTYETQRDLVTSIDSKWSSGGQMVTRTGYTYTYDERGQRSKSVQSGDVYSDYGDVTSQQFDYDGRGQMTAAIAYLGADTTLANKQLPGRRYTFAYDNAGNRKWSDRTGVDANNDELPDLRDNYTTNALNQYTSRENNTLPLSGTAAPDTGGAGGTAVAVGGRNVAAGRQGRYWNDEITVANVSNPWRGPLTIFTAKRGASGGADLVRMDSRMAEIAAVIQNLTYDVDGNLTSDGIIDYTWDAENRLVRMETTVNARNFNFPHKLIELKYDYMGRRVQKRVVDVTQNLELSSRRFLYDGWNLVAEYAAPGGTSIGALIRSYTWGLDIVNTMASAGGVGALLQIADHPSGRTFLPTYDGNGNIASLLNATTGAIAAAYEYSLYGEPLRAQTFDSAIADNPFRFSTKFTDLETGLVYYGHRYYDPRNGRFINRDPIAEAGGLNLYAFCGNNPVNRWDYLGLCDDPDHDLVCREPGEETTDVTTSTTTDSTAQVGDPVDGGSSGNDDGYVGDGDLLEPDFDPFAMTVYTDGQVTGTMSGAEVNALVNEFQASNAAGETDVNIVDGPDAPTATVYGSIETITIIEIDVPVATANSSTAQVAATEGPVTTGSNAAGPDLTFNFTMGESTSVFINEPDSAAAPSPVATTAVVAPAASSSVASGAASTPASVSAAPNNAAASSGSRSLGTFSTVVAGAAVAAPGAAGGGTVIGGGAAAGGGELIAAGVRGGVVGLAVGVALSIPGDAGPPRPQYVVRGGFATPQNLIQGSSYHDRVPGLYGFSVQSAPRAPVDVLVRNGMIPNSTYSVTTAEQLRSVGAVVVPSPGRGGNHSTVVVPAPLSNAQAGLISAQFQTGFPNPYQFKPKR